MKGASAWLDRANALATAIAAVSAAIATILMGVTYIGQVRENESRNAQEVVWWLHSQDGALTRRGDPDDELVRIENMSNVPISEVQVEGTFRTDKRGAIQYAIQTADMPPCSSLTINVADFLNAGREPGFGFSADALYFANAQGVWRVESGQEPTPSTLPSSGESSFPEATVERLANC